MPNLENDIKAHARAHVKDLTARTTELVGEVIAKGMLGILEECIAMHVRIGELEAALATRQSSADSVDAELWRYIVSDGKRLDGMFTLIRCSKNGDLEELTGDQYEAAVRAAIAAQGGKGEKE